MLSQNKERMLARLKSGRGRAKEGLVVVEGIRGAEEALDSGARVRFAVCSSRLEFTDRGRALADRLEADVPESLWIEEDLLDVVAHTETPQGVLLVVEEPRPDLADLGEGGVLALDGVQDPGNAGTLLRSAGAFGLAGVVVLKGSVDPWNSKAVRASAGGAFQLPVVRASASEFLDWAEDAGRSVLVAEAGATDVADFSPAGDWVLVVGSEGEGVTTEIRSGASAGVSIPMPGGAESLNVGVAGSILLYALTRGGTDG
jgi:TrmH family RNA methyltransferase